MSKEKFDTSEPILVVVRQGRRGKGFTVAPVEDAANPEMCMDEKDLGEAIAELLRNEDQPRVDMSQLISGSQEDSDEKPSSDKASSKKDSKSEEAEEDEDEDEDDEDDEPQGDIADRLISQGLAALFQKGRDLSSGSARRRPRARSRRPRKK